MNRIKLEDTRTMAEFCSYHDKLVDIRKMNDDTNEMNLVNFRKLLPDFFLNRESHNKVLEATYDPFIHPLFTRELNPHWRLFIPIELTMDTDETYKAYHDLIYSSSHSLNIDEIIMVTDYKVWTEGKLPDGQKLFKFLMRKGISSMSLERITTERQSNNNYLVISKNPIDWLFMATNQSFTSCMSLRSDYNGAYYMGIPNLIVDPHKFLMFVTPGKLRSYNIHGHSFKHFRYINRTIAIWTNEQRFGFVRFYPHNSINYEIPLFDAGFLVDSRQNNVYEYWRSFNWPKAPKLYFEDEQTICEPYHDHNRTTDFSSYSEYYDNRGSIGTRMSICWTNGFEEIQSFNDLIKETTCDWCGSSEYENNMHWVNDDQICDACYDNSRECYDCSEIVHHDHMYWYEANSCYICESCRHDYYLCDSCHELTHPDDANHDDIDNNIYCPDCATDYMNTCNLCSIYTNVDNLEDGLCNDCRNNLESRLDEIINQIDDLKSQFNTDIEALRIEKEEIEAKLNR